MKSMILTEYPFTPSIDMIETILSRLKNMHKNKKTPPTQSLTIPDSSSHIDGNQESWYLEDYDQDSISPQNFELDQYQLIDKLKSFSSMRLNLKMNVIPIPNVVIRFTFWIYADSGILTLIWTNFWS